MYNAVLGDGDWKSYYAKRKQQAGKAYDDTEIRAELAALEKKVDSIKLPDSSGSTSSYDDTAIWEDVNIAKDDIKKCKQHIQALEAKIKNITANGYDDSELRAMVLDAQSNILLLAGTKADAEEVNNQIAALKEMGYDTTELENKIKQIMNQLPEDGQVTIDQQVINMAQQWSNRTGPLAEIFSRLDALERGASGAPCQNAQEIQVIKQCLSAAGLYETD